MYVYMPGKSHGRRSLVGCSPWGRKESDTTERLHFHFHFHAVEKEMATHSSVLAWRIPGTVGPSGLPSLGSHRVGHDWSALAAAAAAAYIYIGFPGGTSGKEPTCQCRIHKKHGFYHWVGKIPWRRKWQPTLYSCLRKLVERGAWQATVHGVAKCSTQLK